MLSVAEPIRAGPGAEQMTGPLNPNNINRAHGIIILHTHTHARNSGAYKLRHHGERLCHFEVHQTEMKYNQSREQQKHEAMWSLIIKQHKFKAVQHHSG